MKKIYKIILIFIFTVSLIYYGLLVILKSWKYSSFYEPDVNLLENSNLKRIQLALDFFSTNKNTINKYRTRKENNVTHHRPQLCIGVLTAPRSFYKSRRYLLQSMYSILSRFKGKKDRVSVIISIFTNNNRRRWHNKNDFTDHRIDLEIIRPFVDNIVLMDHDVQKPMEKNGNFQKVKYNWLYYESIDYLKALKHCHLNSDADNILLIEDDSFASPNMFVKLSKILKVLKKNVEKNVAYVKLFSTEHFFGFENSDVLFFICVFIIVSYIARKQLKLNLITSFCTGILIIILLETIGKQNLIDPFYFHKGLNQIPFSSIDSNTVAVLFHDHSKVSSLINYMEDISQEKPKRKNMIETDLILDRWSRINKFQRMYSIPSLFQHIGLISGKPWKGDLVNFMNPKNKEMIYRLMYKDMKTSRNFDIGTNPKNHILFKVE